jgi:hypothetical protein
MVDHVLQHVGVSLNVPLGLAAGVSPTVIVALKEPRRGVQSFDDV